METKENKSKENLPRYSDIMDFIDKKLLDSKKELFEKLPLQLKEIKKETLEKL